MKLIERNRNGQRLLYLYCPGCKHAHAFEVPRWKFNENFDKPTFSPSLLNFYTKPQTNERVTVCHFILTDGMIQFCSDCPHELNGKLVELPDFPDDYHIGE